MRQRKTNPAGSHLHMESTKKEESEVRLCVGTEESQGVRGGGTRRQGAKGTRPPLYG